MSGSTAYKCACVFCNAIQDVFTSLHVANKAASVASRSDHEKAKAIVLENRI